MYFWRFLRMKKILLVNNKKIKTIKDKNKIVLRTNNKNQAANKIAEFYLSAMKT